MITEVADLTLQIGHGPGLSAWAPTVGTAIVAAIGVTGTYLTGSAGRKEAKQLAADLRIEELRGAARLAQNDFNRLQGTFKRAIRGNRWWNPGELLAWQIEKADRHVLMARLTDDQSEDVSRALGWSEYHLHRRREDLGADAPTPEKLDIANMYTAWWYLELAREALADAADRPFKPHDVKGVIGAEEPANPWNPGPHKPPAVGGV